MTDSAPAFTIELVEAGGERIPCVRRGPPEGPRLMMLQPLFEEMNRTRRLLALTGAVLAGLGIQSWLPDLPGMGDHPAPEFCLARARDAAGAIADVLGKPAVVAVRGGALLVPETSSAYLLAPITRGDRLLRELLRARAAEEDSGVTVAGLEAALAAGETVEAAGYSISAALAEELRAAVQPAGSGPARIAGIGDGGEADMRFEGPPVWRQAEAEDARALAAALGEDVARWIRQSATRS